MRDRLAALAAGLVFGVGLVLSGMTNPAKVTGFLDVFGRWDPSLAFVMIGAIGVHGVLLRVVLRRGQPLFAGGFQIPKNTTVDGRLVLGAAVFGVGWGLGGICPGPGIVDAASGSLFAVVFIAAMALGALAATRARSALGHEPSPERAVPPTAPSAYG